MATFAEMVAASQNPTPFGVFDNVSRLSIGIAR